MNENTKDFIWTWQRAHSLDQVAKATGLTRGAARTRASRLRKSGVGLKKFTDLDVEEAVRCAELAKAHAAGDAVLLSDLPGPLRDQVQQLLANREAQARQRGGL